MDCEYISKLKKGCAFVPCYVKDRGKITKIYFIDGGSGYLPCSMNKVLNDYCAINMRSLKQIKAVCQKVTGRKNIVPLYIKEQGVFLPIKTIRPYIIGDSCIGYVNVNYIKDINFDRNKIQLTNGTEISFLDGGETIKRRMGDCSIIHKRIL